MQSGSGAGSTAPPRRYVPLEMKTPSTNHLTRSPLSDQRPPLWTHAPSLGAGPSLTYTPTRFRATRETPTTRSPYLVRKSLKVGYRNWSPEADHAGCTLGELSIVKSNEGALIAQQRAESRKRGIFVFRIPTAVLLPMLSNLSYTALSFLSRRRLLSSRPK
ncbi:hypothetical protein B0H14DRAFT_2630610 [Mycena olivaceomarginata]|nr:hypothetical protein B0H14DRAFT_2630610 [Mycena olivaceomarginata]